MALIVKSPFSFDGVKIKVGLYPLSKEKNKYTINGTVIVPDFIIESNPYYFEVKHSQTDKTDLSSLFNKEELCQSL